MAEIKLNDDQFFAALRKAGGLYSRCVRLVKKEYQIDISRQAIRERALKHPELLEDIKEESKDIAEEGIHGLMRSKTESIRLKACLSYLKGPAKDRGYIDKKEIDHNGKISINVIDYQEDEDE